MWQGLTNSPLLALWHLQGNYSLGFLLESHSEDLYRVKGILSIAGSPRVYGRRERMAAGWLRSLGSLLSREGTSAKCLV